MCNVMELLNSGQINQVNIFNYIAETDDPSELFDSIDNKLIEIVWRFVNDYLKDWVVSLHSIVCLGPVNNTDVQRCETIVLWVKDYKHFKSDSFIDVVLTLCSILTISLEGAGFVSLKHNISNVCLLWWQTNEESAVNFVTFLIPYLLLLCTDQDAKESDFKRLMDISGAFALLDFHHPASSAIKDLIIECFRKSVGGCKKERKKVLLFFLTLEKGVILEHVWPAIKLLIMTTKGCIAANFYGSTFLGVWRKEIRIEGGEEVSIMIEDLMQELLSDAIHCSKNVYFCQLRACLSSFVDGNRDAEMHAMLRRVYGPVLFRSLRSANGLVRTQSSVLFFDVFPLHDSHGSAEDDDALLQRQFDLFSALLKDEDHRVRASAASGGCHILSQHWNSLPVSTTHDILTHLIKKLSVDNSCASVRLAVLNGLSHLLENQPLSHPILKKLLPFLAGSIHDSSERVRIKFLSLLLKVKHVREMHVQDIVSSDTLITQLVVDSSRPQVCFALTELLTNTFFPTSTSEGETSGSIGPAQVRRCIEFANLNQNAAEVFYAHLHKHIPVGRLVKFVVILSSLLFNSDNKITNKMTNVGKAKTGKSSKRSREPDQSITTLDSVLNDDDALSNKIMLRIVLWILVSLATVDDVGRESVTLLVKYFSSDALRHEIEAQLDQKSQDLETLLVWLRIASTITSLIKSVADSSDDDDSEYPLGAVRVRGRVILQHFASHGSISITSTSTNRWRALSDSLVLSLCSLNQEDDILGFICDSFGSSLTSSASVLSFAADLFVSYISSMNEKRREVTPMLSKVFDSAKLLASDLLNNNTLLSFELSSTVSLIFETWCFCALFECFSETGLCDEIFSWCSQNIFSRLSVDNKDITDAILSSGSERLVGVALLVLSDSLYLGVASKSALADGEAWLSCLTKFIEASSHSLQTQRSTQRILSAVISPVCRVGCVLSELCKVEDRNDIRLLGRASLDLLTLIAATHQGEHEYIEIIKKSLNDVI